MSAIDTALSGLTAFAKKLDVSANNVANVNTDGFHKSRVESVEVGTGGVLPVVQKDDSAGPAVLKDRGYGAAQVELSNVDLGESFIDMIAAQRGFQANSRVITTSDEILQELVNLKR